MFLNETDAAVRGRLLISEGADRLLGVGPNETIAVNVLLAFAVNLIWHLGNFEPAFDAIQVDTRRELILAVAESYNCWYEFISHLRHGRLLDVGIEQPDIGTAPRMKRKHRVFRWLAGTLLYIILIGMTVGTIYLALPRKRAVNLSMIRTLKLRRGSDYKPVSIGNFTTHSFAKPISVEDQSGAISLDNPPVLSVARTNLSRASQGFEPELENIVEAYVSEGRRLLLTVKNSRSLFQYKFRVDLYLSHPWAESLQLNCSGLIGSPDQNSKDKAALGRLVEISGGRNFTFAAMVRPGVEGTGIDVGWRAAWRGKFDLLQLNVTDEKVTLGDVIIVGLLETTELFLSSDKTDYYLTVQGKTEGPVGANDGRIATDNAPCLTVFGSLLLLLFLQLLVAILLDFRCIRNGRLLQLGTLNALGGDGSATLYTAPVVTRAF